MFDKDGALEFDSPFKTLVAVMLSAQTRDEQVLKLLPGLFEAFPNPESFANAELEDVIAKVNTIGMYRQKSKNLIKLSKDLVEKFNGEVPRTIEELTALAGIGRKTASVVLPAVFNKPAIAVDVHVHRVVNRLGWVKTKRPEQTEKELLKLIPPEYHAKVNRVFVKFGRYVCLSRSPRCYMCPIVDSCPFKEKQLDMPPNIDRIKEKIEKQEALIDELKSHVN